MAYQFQLPDMGEGLTEAQVVRWLVEPGEEIEADQAIVEVETDKAVVEVPTPRAGVLLRRGAEEGEVLEVGAVLAVIGEAGEEMEESVAEGEAAPIVGTLEEADADPPAGGAGPGPGSRDGAARPQALPVVRRLAGELGVDLAGIEGSGPGGRITRADVEGAAGRQAAGPSEGEERVELSRLRRTIARHMERSWQEIPHVTTFGEAEATRLLSARRRLAERRRTSLPLEAFLIKAVIPALGQFPELNASLEGQELVLKRHYDIGVAVDTPEGLIVPVVKGADALSLMEVAERIAELAEATRRRTVSPDDLTGSTFTVSNIGAVGGGFGTPIIPYGTTAILSVGRAEERPVVRGGRVEAAPLLPLSLSFDHRVVDGALGRRFLAMVTDLLEEPALFLAD